MEGGREGRKGERERGREMCIFKTKGGKETGKGRMEGENNKLRKGRRYEYVK